MSRCDVNQEQRWKASPSRLEATQLPGRLRHVDEARGDDVRRFHRTVGLTIAPGDLARFARVLAVLAIAAELAAALTCGTTPISTLS
jgi:hypothetical protein